MPTKIIHAQRIDHQEILVTFEGKMQRQEFSKFSLWKENQEITITKFHLRNREKRVLVHFAEKVLPNYNLVLKNKKHSWIVRNAYSYLNSAALMYQGKLGCSYLFDKVECKIWAPETKKMSLLLYDKNDPNLLLQEFPMEFNSQTFIWEVELNFLNSKIKNLDGYFYHYKNDQGSLLLDPYASSMAAFNFLDAKNTPAFQDPGKACIINWDSEKVGKKPQSINIENINQDPLQMIAYELHIRDFTIALKDSQLDQKLRGTYLGLARWEKGIEHLKKLGISHIQVLPIHKCFTLNENHRDFVLEASGEKTNYNWGYDPHNYFTLNGWLSTKADDPYARIREFRELVNTFHKNNLGVIVDVVYNHLFDNRLLNAIQKNVYFRSQSKIVPVSDPALASENPMTRKLILDSIDALVENYDIDGIRFDLMGFMDSKTIRLIREKHPNLILHGEAWNFSDLKRKDLAPIIGTTQFIQKVPSELEEQFTKDKYSSKIAGIFNHGIANLGYFNDRLRNYIKGVGHEKGTLKPYGFIFEQKDLRVEAKESLKHKLLVAIAGNTRENILIPSSWKSMKQKEFFASETTMTLQYLSIHDNATLWDTINSASEDSLDVKLHTFKLALTILLLSYGKIILHNGVEILRSKRASGKEKDQEHILYLENKIDLFDGWENKNFAIQTNSYKSSDYTNMIDWEKINQEPFKSIHKFLQSLILLRKELLFENNVKNFRVKIKPLEISKSFLSAASKKLTPAEKTKIIFYQVEHLNGQNKILTKYIVCHNANQNDLKMSSKDFVDYDVWLSNEVFEKRQCSAKSFIIKAKTSLVLKKKLE